MLTGKQILAANDANGPHTVLQIRVIRVIRG